MKGASFYQSNFTRSKKPEARLACGKFNPLSFPARRSLQSQNTNRQPPKSGKAAVAWAESFCTTPARCYVVAGESGNKLLGPVLFAFAIQDETREINLLLGRDYDKPLASKQAGTLNLIDTPEGLEFAVDALPDTSYVR